MENVKSINELKLTKKHNFLYYYSEKIKKIIYAIIGLLLLNIGYFILKNISDYIFSSQNIYQSIVNYLLFIGLCLLFITIIYKVVGHIYFVFMRLYNIQYLPISHDECIKYDIKDINEYIQLVNEQPYCKTIRFPVL